MYKPAKLDISWMVNLSHKKRLEYSKSQPHFWKMAKNSDILQEKWFEEEIATDRVIALCAEDKKGFIIGKIINSPEVYDAGLTLVVDDFCVESPDLWPTVGSQLLNEVTSTAKQKGVIQIVVVCGDHDFQKVQLLEKLGLGVASRWYTKTISMDY